MSGESKKEYMRQWRIEHRAHTRQYEYRRRMAAKEAVYAHYGDACACCGETQREFLCLDHKNGGGNKHRLMTMGTQKSGGPKWYQWIISQGCPAYLQILCANCNQSKARHNNQCIHGREN